MINTFYPPWRGGAETYVKNLAENFARMGHEVQVVAAHQPLSPGEYFQDGVVVKRLKSAGMFYGVPIIPELLQYLVSIDTDLIHVNFPNPFNAAIGALASIIKKIPAVLTWHNDLPSVTKLAGSIVRIHDDLAAPIYLKYYDSIITTSNIYHKKSKMLRKFQNKTKTIFNGVDCKRFNPDVYSEDIKIDLEMEDSKIILFVAALTKWHRYKGLDILIEAFKLIRDMDIKLLVVGGGGLKSEYEAYTRNVNLTDKVIFAGEVSDDLLPKYYSIADMLVLPSKDRSEGFGLTILEANASGKPVIGSNIGGIPGILTDNDNGILVPPNNPTLLADAICRLSNDDKLRERMGERGRQIAIMHDWSRVAAETEKIYFELLN
ncbi:glycosyltransferase family 1 protein [Candidatus Bathyarchaeota archaeon]|nr:glycosyltransferase family 1 protein [Candidatus Bathyarchaeota archaeon]